MFKKIRAIFGSKDALQESSTSRENEINWFIIVHKRRLAILEQQQAHKGLDTPPMIVTEIEELKRKIAELKEKSKEMDELVNPASSDQTLPFQTSVEAAQSMYLERASSCPRCKTSADQLSWYFYTSPDQDWQALAGRAGWITVCEGCHIQVDFFIFIMN
jgi:hypothetical protein